MIALEQAVIAAEERKVAVFGECEPGLEMGGEQHMRRLFSGFDIDPDELMRIVEHVQTFFHASGAVLPAPFLYGSAWCDGILVGLLLAHLQAQESRRDAA